MSQGSVPPAEDGERRIVEGTQREHFWDKVSPRARQVGGGMLLIVALCWLFYHNGAPKEEDKATAKKDIIGQVVPTPESPPPPPIQQAVATGPAFFPQLPPPPMTAAVAAPPPLPATEHTSESSEPQHLLAFGGRQSAGAPAPAPAGGPGGERGAEGAFPQGSQQTALGARLKPTEVAMASATMLPSRRYLISAGRLILCTLDTEVDSNLPGPVVCHLEHDVRSDDDSLTLLDRGTRILGEYQNDTHQGDHRLFTLTGTVTTPKGVRVYLKSPMGDGVGRSGLGADEVNNHFWSKFGGALLLMTTEGISSAASSALSAHGSTNINLGAGEQAVTEILRNTINIPPTITKHRGAQVAILLIQDIDFSDVYSVGLAGGGR